MAAVLEDGRSSEEGPKRFFVLSGCSGGGKSSIVAALARRGVAVVPEPGRRIVEAAEGPRDPVLPWNDLEIFARAAIAMAKADYEAARSREGPVVFDRSLIDAWAALEAVSGKRMPQEESDRHPYASPALLVPPWPEIWQRDEARRHDFSSACEEYERLLAIHRRLGYQVVIVPKAPVEERVDFCLARIGHSAETALSTRSGDHS
ncbi:ATPase [Fulvimarina endophytica]|uniref:ATPase n=1 Tax=Fulvimarina endophytica TaxID=2293836 RepID=A0A371X4Y0_9HYPH|nr:AAA family ATPase [Fulvimarina endophytica]RFC64286.1 ATPase [Fulvimarina endophytica]